MSIRDEIRELCLTHDKQMAEDRQWLAQYGAQARSPVSESDDDEIIYKEFDNNALASAASGKIEEQDWSDWEKWMRAHLDIERAEILNIVTEALVEVVAETRRELRQEPDLAVAELERKLADLRAENAEIKGLVGGVLMLLGKSCNVQDSKAAEVVDLPDWRKRHA